MRQAQSLDLAAQEQAEALLKAAKQSEAAATRAENDKAHAHGGARAAHLRSYWTPILTDPSAGLRHYVTTNSEAVKAFLLDLAVKDVASGKRTVPGFEITEERKVA
jgi:Xaa-Pro aminopeptidase